MKNLLDIESVDVVKIHQENEVDLKRDMYNSSGNLNGKNDEEKMKNS